MMEKKNLTVVPISSLLSVLVCCNKQILSFILFPLHRFKWTSKCHAILF